jgi:hypothetical protein
MALMDNKDTRWSGRFIPAVRDIIAKHLVTVASVYEDQHLATDLVVLQATSRAQRIACRLRRAKYIDRYGQQFTVRSSTRDGSPSELEKILDGWGDAMFYGFANDEHIVQWFLGDLDVFRTWYDVAVPEVETHSNGPGDRQFMAFNVDDLPDSFVIAKG